MNKEDVMKYSPWIGVALMFFYQYNVFVTPVQLEKTHMEILKEIKSDYANKEVINRLENQYNNMQYKIDEIYKIISRKGGLT